MQSPLYFRNNSMDSDFFRTQMKPLQAGGRRKGSAFVLVLTHPPSFSPPPFFYPKGPLRGMCAVTCAPSPGFKKNPHPSDSAGQLPRDSAQRGLTCRYAWPWAQRWKEARSDLSLPAETPGDSEQNFWPL